MTYEDWGARVKIDQLAHLDSPYISDMYADWTEDRKKLLAYAAEVGAAAVHKLLDEALNMGDGTYKP